MKDHVGAFKGKKRPFSRVLTLLCMARNANANVVCFRLSYDNLKNYDSRYISHIYHLKQMVVNRLLVQCSHF